MADGGTIFDYSWTSGPLGPGPFLLFSGTYGISDRAFVGLAPGMYAAGDNYQLAGAMVQYGTAAAAPALTLFRRNISRRTGSRGPQCTP